MNTVTEMNATQIASAKENAQHFAQNEGNLNQNIRKMGEDAMTYWSFFKRKTGVVKYQALCAEAGVRRVIDGTVQKRFASLSFAAKYNEAILSVGERVWASIVDRVVLVSATGKVEWRKLRDNKGNETDQTTEKTFCALDAVQMKLQEGAHLDRTFPPKNILEKQEKEAAIEAGKAILSDNFLSALKGKSKEDAITAMVARFKEYPSDLRLWIKEALDKAPAAPVKEVKAPNVPAVTKEESKTLVA